MFLIKLEWVGSLSLFLTDGVCVDLFAQDKNQSQGCKALEHAVRLTQENKVGRFRAFQCIQTRIETQHCMWLSLLRLSLDDQRLGLRSLTDRCLVLGNSSLYLSAGQTTLLTLEHKRIVQQNKIRYLQHRQEDITIIKRSSE